MYVVQGIITSIRFRRALSGRRLHSVFSTPHILRGVFMILAKYVHLDGMRVSVTLLPITVS
jgi:hypothetical protein